MYWVLQVIVTDDSLSVLLKDNINIVPSPKHDSTPPLDVPTNYRKSIRSSFIDNFISSRLSDILEFESESVGRQTFEDLDFQEREIHESGSDSSLNHNDFVTKLLTSSLGHNERLHNGCVDTEHFPLKVASDGLVFNCSISSSLVSAMVIFMLIFIIPFRLLVPSSWGQNSISCRSLSRSVKSIWKVVPILSKLCFQNLLILQLHHLYVNLSWTIQKIVEIWILIIFIFLKFGTTREPTQPYRYPFFQSSLRSHLFTTLCNCHIGITNSKRKADGRSILLL